MNPYHAVAVAQHNQSLLLIARETRAADPIARADAPPGRLARVLRATSDALRVTAGTDSALPKLRDYPVASRG